MAYTENDIKELKRIVELNRYVPNQLNIYKNLYSIFLNKRFAGCSCAASVMFHELKAFYNLNKDKLNVNINK